VTWDDYYLGLCNAVASNSKCYSRKIGAILVRDKVVICTGYNGPPRGYPHCQPYHLPCGTCHGTGILHNGDLVKPIACTACGGGGTLDICQRRGQGYTSGQGLHLCPAAHAERNAIDQAARLGIKVEGSTMYMNCPVPCKDCLLSIIQSGVVEVVCINTTAYYDFISGKLMDNSNLKVREYNNE
jgi:dCMP deaminase